MSETPKSIVVIGAGIAGVASALFLQRDGHIVTILDPRGVGEGASFGNAGTIAPTSCVPTARPDTMKRVPKMLLDPASLDTEVQEFQDVVGRLKGVARAEPAPAPEKEGGPAADAARVGPTQSPAGNLPAEGPAVAGGTDVTPAAGLPEADANRGWTPSTPVKCCIDLAGTKTQLT